MHRGHLEDLSVVSVLYLCDLCEKFFAFLLLYRKIMNNPGYAGSEDRRCQPLRSTAKIMMMPFMICCG